MVVDIFNRGVGTLKNINELISKISAAINQNNSQQESINELEEKSNLLTEYPKTNDDESEAIIGNNKELTRGFQAVDLQLFRVDVDRVAAGVQSALIGGRNNLVNSISSGIFCGENNLIESLIARAVILGGNTNKCIVTQGGIVGGFENRLLIGSDDSFIGGGGGCEIQHGFKSTVLGGNNLLIRGVELGTANECVVAGGSGNRILQSTNRSSIIAGLDNLIFQSEDCGIIGGTINRILSGSRYAFVGGGFDNSIQNSEMGAVIGSTLSKIEGGLDSAHSNESALLAGSQNNIQGASPRSVIVGGIENYISQGADSGIIACNNSSCRSQNGFLAGCLTGILQTGSPQSIILGGVLNQVYSSPNSAIIGGDTNIIDGRGVSISSNILIGQNNNCTHSNCIILSGNASTVNSSSNDELIFDANSYRISDQERMVCFQKIYQSGFSYSGHLHSTPVPVQKTAGVHIEMWYSPTEDGPNTSASPGYTEAHYIVWKKPDSSFHESLDIQQKPLNPNGVTINLSLLSQKIYLTTLTPSSSNDWLCRFKITYLFDIVNDFIKP